MMVAIMGLFSFLLFGIYDINQVKWKRKVFNGFFFIGLIILIASTTWLLVSSKVFVEATAVQIIMLIISGGFFLLLIYALFIAIPFSKTYIVKEDEGVKKVCDQGMYRLCRHPGFLWFTAAYIFLALGIENTAAALVVAVFIVFNFAYVVLQDLWTFPHLFEDYETYKKNVPFLIPTARSIKCVFAIKRKEG